MTFLFSKEVNSILEIESPKFFRVSGVVYCKNCNIFLIKKAEDF